jgi:ribosomal protein L32
MGALPKRRISTQRKGKRRKTKNVSLLNLINCPNCSAKKLPHVRCPECGK